MVDAKDIQRLVFRLLAPVRNAAKNIAKRGVLGSVDVSGQGTTFQAQTSAQDIDDAVELMQAHGFWSTPPDGAEGVILRVGGSRSASVGVCFGSRGARPGGLQQGDTAVYNSDGALVVLRASGSIEVTPAAGQSVFLGGTEGALDVARVTDPVMAAPDFQTWITAISTAVATMSAAFNVAGPLVGAPATVLPSLIEAMVAPTDFGLIETGSDTVHSV